MARNKKALKKVQVYTGLGQMTLHLEFKQSLVYAQMIKVDIDVLGYVYSRLRFAKCKKKGYGVEINNGSEAMYLSMEYISENLGWCRATISHSVGRLIGWGLMKCVIIGGDNCAHTYKILINANPFGYESVVPTKEERWRRWTPTNHWNSERPKTSGNCTIGLATRYKNKIESLPNKLNREGVTNYTDKGLNKPISVECSTDNDD